jgi:hypothetical protein
MPEWAVFPFPEAYERKTTADEDELVEETTTPAPVLMVSSVSGRESVMFGDLVVPSR